MIDGAAPRFELPGFKGQVLRPDHDGYDDARRVFNGMIDRRPAIIARCTDADDVVMVVDLARQNDLPSPSMEGVTASRAQRWSMPGSAPTCGA